MNRCQETEVITALLLSRNQQLDRRQRHLLTHELTRQYALLTNRIHRPDWIRRLGRSKTTDGHPGEVQRSDQWIPDPCHRVLREKDLTVPPLEENLSLITRIILLQQLRQSNLRQVVQEDTILRFIKADKLSDQSR